VLPSAPRAIIDNGGQVFRSKEDWQVIQPSATLLDCTYIYQVVFIVFQKPKHHLRVEVFLERMTIYPKRK